MANTFNNSTYNNIGATEQIVYSTGLGKKATVIGINIANLLSTPVTANIILEKTIDDRGTPTIVRTFVVKDVYIPAGNSLAAIGGDQKLVMTEENNLIVSAGTGLTDALDVIVSVLEIT